MIRPLAGLLASCLAGSAIADPACPPETGVALQVLGSGGPIADDGRASTGYLLWHDGQARVLVDIGGGTFVRLGEAGARFEDLELVALSHFHTDHSADLPALLKSGYFSDRTAPLPILGPSGSGPFPDLDGFLAALLDPERGAFAYLSGYLDGSGGLVRLEATTIDHEAATPTISEIGGGITVSALGVPHGIVPSIAYRVTLGGRTVVFGSDQDGSRPAFVDFARGADLLVLHLVIPEDAGEAARSLHATPSTVGRMAAAADPGAVVLSHFMARSLRAIDTNVGHVTAVYDGPVHRADDLACYVVPGT